MGNLPPGLYSFTAGERGPWRIRSINAIAGAPLPSALRVDIKPAETLSQLQNQSWTLHGTTSNERYVTQSERATLVSKQEGLGREAATLAALIPIRKSATWWGLAQDDRRQLLEEQSHHISIGLRYIPAIARRLYHCRDLGVPCDFDFLTWFEYSPADEDRFDELLHELRSTTEWTFVDRECDIRLIRSPVDSSDPQKVLDCRI